MVLFKWEDRYLVGINQVDEQHKRLVHLINDLHEAMLEGRGKAETHKVLLKLIDYSMYHFTTEEKLMEKHGYDELVRHQTQHLSFVDKVKDLSRRHDEGEYMISIETNEFLKEWLSSHILVSDKRLGPYLRSKGER
ncbi:MAG: bacteriohemerythrin [Thermoplasmatota archaeon]